MPIRLFNTLSAQIENFCPRDPDRVTMYVCGPTVYNHIHVGNARPIVVFDILYRLLKHDYPNVVYVRNITDIDDKIIKAARDNATTSSEIAQRYTDLFHHDIQSLNTLEPDIEPCATGHIDGMQTMIECLIDNGSAYVAEGHVLFDTQSYRGFGILSKRQRAELIDGARVDIAPYKKDPADFVLWKPSVEDQPGWDSPWGYGRPGWHLECSVMAKTYLGEEFDIHGGGQDLVFPHHENEIAQSCCAHGGKIPARYWVHNGHVLVDGRKMAKSAGNFFTMDEVLKQFPGETVRYTLLKTHYHKPLDWSVAALKEAHSNLSKLYDAVSSDTGTIDIPPDAKPHAGVVDALRNNLNTVEAIRIIHELAKNKERELLHASCNMMGFLQSTPDAWFKWQGTDTEATWSDKEINELIAQRHAARAQNDYKQADAIRTKLEKAGIVLEDSGTKTKWKRKV